MRRQRRKKRSFSSVGEAPRGRFACTTTTRESQSCATPRKQTFRVLRLAFICKSFVLDNKNDDKEETHRTAKKATLISTNKARRLFGLDFIPHPQRSARCSYRISHTCIPYFNGVIGSYKPARSPKEKQGDRHGQHLSRACVYTWIIKGRIGSRPL